MANRMEPQSSLVDEGVAAFDIFKSSNKNANIYQSLEELFKEKLTINVIKCVSRNIKLFHLYQHIEGEKFMSIKKALMSLAEDNSRTKVLIHFTELNLYGLFTPANYTALVQNMQERFENDSNISFRPRQIILTGLPQKLIFICIGDDTIVEKIREYVAEKYKCDIRSIKTDNRTEITVQKVGGNSYDEMQKSYRDLLQHIGNNNLVRQNILPMPIESTKQHEYITADLSCDLSQQNSIDDIISSLKTVHGGNIVLNLTIVNGGTNTIVNGTNNIHYKISAKDIAKQWIHSNPPKNREKKSDYYGRYKNSNEEILADSLFSKIVIDFGKYESIKSNGIRYWIVK